MPRNQRKAHVPAECIMTFKCKCPKCGHEFELVGNEAELEYDYTGCYYEGDRPSIKLYNDVKDCPGCGWTLKLCPEIYIC